MTKDVTALGEQGSIPTLGLEGQEEGWSWSSERGSCVGGPSTGAGAFGETTWPAYNTPPRESQGTNTLTSLSSCSPTPYMCLPLAEPSQKWRKEDAVRQCAGMNLLGTR